jgi:DNA-binding transcriptional MerR regulator
MNNKNLFSIGEIAKAVGITRKTILNYETKGLITPDKKDGMTGNRYYTIDTFTQVRTIRVFQDLGLSLDEIHDYFTVNADLHPMINRLEKMRDELNLMIEKLKERENNQQNIIKEIVIEPQTIYRRTYNSVSIEDKTNLLRDTALEAMRLHGTDVTRYMYFTEHSANTPLEISYCVAIPPESEGEYVVKIPELKAISVFHHGAYEDIPTTRNRLIAYSEENSLKLTGVFRNTYLEGPPQHKDKSKFITQITAILEQSDK